MLWLSPRIQQLPAAIPFSTIQRIPDIFLLYMHKYIYSHINTHIYLSIYTDFHTTLWSLNCMHVYTYIFSVTRPLLPSSLSLFLSHPFIFIFVVNAFQHFVHIYTRICHVYTCHFLRQHIRQLRLRLTYVTFRITLALIKGWYICISAVAIYQLYSLSHCCQWSDLNIAHIPTFSRTNIHHWTIDYL